MTTPSNTPGENLYKSLVADDRIASFDRRMMVSTLGFFFLAALIFVILPPILKYSSSIGLIVIAILLIPLWMYWKSVITSKLLYIKNRYPDVLQDLFGTHDVNKIVGPFGFTPRAIFLSGRLLKKEYQAPFWKGQSKFLLALLIAIIILLLIVSFAGLI